MSRATGKKVGRLAVARVDGRLGRMGQRIGLFTGLTRLSIEYARNVQQLLAEQRTFSHAVFGTRSGQSAVTRAEERLDNFGQRIGFFAGRARRRIQDTGKTLGLAQEDQLKAAPGEKPGPPTTVGPEEPEESTTEKAEELVNRMGQRINRLSSLASQSVIKATAYVREEAEDVWVEAQSIRRNIHPQNG
jgi:hypothetical protein